MTETQTEMTYSPEEQKALDFLELAALAQARGIAQSDATALFALGIPVDEIPLVLAFAQARTISERDPIALVAHLIEYGSLPEGIAATLDDLDITALETRDVGAFAEEFVYERMGERIPDVVAGSIDWQNVYYTQLRFDYYEWADAPSGTLYVIGKK